MSLLPTWTSGLVLESAGLKFDNNSLCLINDIYRAVAIKFKIKINLIIYLV